MIILFLDIIFLNICNILIFPEELATASISNQQGCECHRGVMGVKVVLLPRCDMCAATGSRWLLAQRRGETTENVQNLWSQRHAWELLTIRAEDEIICRLTGMVMSFQNITTDTAILLVTLLLLEERLFGI